MLIVLANYDKQETNMALTIVKFKISSSAKHIYSKEIMYITAKHRAKTVHNTYRCS